MKKTLLILIGLSLTLNAQLTSAKQTVVDSETGLMWQDNKASVHTKKTWKQAKQYCKNLQHAGFSDWYLPSVKELLTITDKSSYKPSLAHAFTNRSSSAFWSSSAFVSNTYYAWYVYFKYGYSNSYSKSSNYYVRCVRAGQSKTLTFDAAVQSSMEKHLGSIVKPNFNLKLVKDMFETKVEFDARVAKAKGKQAKAIQAYKQKVAKAKKRVKKIAIKEVLEATYGKPTLSNLTYDAENGYFVANLAFEAKPSFKQKVAIKVPRSIYAKKDSLKTDAVFDYDGKSVTLKRVEVPFKGKSYLAQFTNYDIQDTQVAVNLHQEVDVDLGVESSVSVASNEVKHFDASGLKSYNDLERLLRKAKKVKTSSKKWLFVVGIENYEFSQNISFAKRSAVMFQKMANKVLGVPKQNSYVMLDRDASQARVKTGFKKMLRRVKKGDTIYFYYNGHGIPVPSLKNEPFMLTADTEPDYVQDETFFSLQNIYSKLSNSKAKKVIAVVDSCFSGVTDGKAVLKGVAAARLRAKKVSFNKQKMVVLSAGKANQYSNGYNKKGYRLFSFFVMKNILEGKTKVDRLFRNVQNQTYETSLKEYGDLRSQEPTSQGNIKLSL